MLYVAPDQLSVAYEQDDLTSFVESIGYILGAASCCSDIDRPRILAATDKIKGIVEASAADETRTRVCDVAFHDGLAAGAKAVGSGELDRAQAGAALAVLEGMIGR